MAQVGGKNQIINNYKNYKKEINKSIPKMYAAIALALNKCEIPNEDIEYIFGLSQDIWEYVVQHNQDILELCIKETGIDLRSK